MLQDYAFNSAVNPPPKIKTPPMDKKPLWYVVAHTHIEWFYIHLLNLSSLFPRGTSAFFFNFFNSIDYRDVFWVNNFSFTHFKYKKHTILKHWRKIMPIILDLLLKLSEFYSKSSLKIIAIFSTLFYYKFDCKAIIVLQVLSTFTKYSSRYRYSKKKKKTRLCEYLIIEIFYWGGLCYAYYSECLSL